MLLVEVVFPVLAQGLEAVEVEFVAAALVDDQLLDAELGRQLARAYNDTAAEDIKGDDRFIGCAWIYLPDIQESIRELRRAVKSLP